MSLKVQYRECISFFRLGLFFLLSRGKYYPLQHFPETYVNLWRQKVRNVSMWLTLPLLWSRLWTEVFALSTVLSSRPDHSEFMKDVPFSLGITWEGITADYPKAPLRFIPNANGVVRRKMMMWCRGFQCCTNMTVKKNFPLTNDKLF